MPRWVPKPLDNRRWVADATGVHAIHEEGQGLHMTACRRLTFGEATDAKPDVPCPACVAVVGDRIQPHRATPLAAPRALLAGRGVATGRKVRKGVGLGHS